MRIFPLFTALALSAGYAHLASAELPPLIPRDVLFGNPERAGPQLSPDGKLLAYLRPDDKNVMQVWVRTLGQDDAQLHRNVRALYFRSNGA